MIDRGTSKKIITRLKKEYPDVAPPLKYINIYQLCIAVVLSAQTTDNQVNRVTPILFKKYGDFAALAFADVNEVEHIIKPTGFYHTKAKHIIALSQHVIEKFNGNLPADRGKLMSLPGIGRKSANVILAAGFNVPSIPVDTHVARVALRIGYCSSKKVYEIETMLMESIDESEWITAHFLFIYHGRNTCMARKPQCSNCPITVWCSFENKNL